MYLKNFWYSYKNILINQIDKKNYSTFIRKIFGTLYKFNIKIFKYFFSKKIINLDKVDENSFIDLSLDEIFIHFNCDKGSKSVLSGKKINTHNYSIFYEKYLYSLKKNEINILEIGSHEGKGIASFYFYFPFAKFIGANINPFQMKFKSKRIQELFIDVTSPKVLNNFSRHINLQDIIIDDASHNLRDILITLSTLFKNLKSGGIYILEDMDQFQTFKELNPYPNELTPKQILNKIINKENFESSFIKNQDMVYLANNIKDIKIEKGSMMMKGNNISDIAFIYKK
tara:strand:+ start:1372 stop:2226 length:855 start_codon:yes stop_codon:yes gene_type:complete